MADEIQVFDVRLVGDDSFAVGEKSAEHVNDQLIGEASLALIEEMLEVFLELGECLGHLDEFGLHLWGDLLIEWELFNQ